MKTYEVKLFIIGLGSHFPMESVLVDANTQEEAEQEAYERYSAKGYGVYDSEEVAE